ncbi:MULTISPECIES: putative holin-like toxin [Bacillus]|nr:putative holin-like toxin [Bacillus sp. TSO22]
MTVYQSLMIMINFCGLILNTVLLITNMMMFLITSQKRT